MQAPHAIDSEDIKLLKELLAQAGESEAIPMLERLMA